MKLLFDQNLSAKLCSGVADLFPNSAHVHTLGLSEADDRTIWNFARSAGYSIVTRDADFSEMSAILRSPPKIIWLRIRNQPTGTILHLLRLYSEIIIGFEEDDAVACLEIYD